ncbi:MAG: DUF1015 family protein, partial [Steroidobacteraceae bacterium]
EYTVTGHVARSTREGFIALGQLEDYESGVVFRHEKTLTAPKADRLELLRHTETQTGQLFMLYDDPRGEAEKLLTQATRGKPATEVRDEYDVLHRLWAVEDAATIARVQLAMADKKLVIADGHHRYETALNYRDECRARSGARDANAPYERAMMTFVNSRSRGLTILPTHRVVRQLENFNWEKFRERVSPYFHWYAYPFANAEERAESYAQWRKDLAARAREGGAIGAYPAKGAFFLFVARRGPALDGLLAELSEAQRRLDVVLLHHVMLEKGLGIRPEEVTSEQHITYEREIDRAIAAVDSGEARLALLLNAVHIGQMMEIALAGEVLPQKSTDFYPKLLSGLVLYRLNG